MRVGAANSLVLAGLWMVALCGARAQAPDQSSSSKHTKGSSARLAPDIDTGTVTDGVYRNRALALACKIPAGWVLRTEEMNANEPDEGSGDNLQSSQDGEVGHPDDANKNPHLSQNQGEVGHPASSSQARVLLAAFSRPPAARGEEVNSSMVIAAERVEAYPGLKEAAQYFGPLTEVAKAQGFAVDEEPYEIQIGTKILVRADFHKDVGSRVMRQSTLAFLAHGYAISITAIAGAEEEVEGLIEGLSFQGSAKVAGPKK